MRTIRHLVSGILLCSAVLVVCAFAQSTLTQIRDTVYNSDGTPFNGTVVITWYGFNNSGNNIAPLSTSAQIYDGVLSVLLVPSTTTPGAYYVATFNSNDGTTTWTQTWNVPPSSTPLTLSQVQSGSSGSGGGSGSNGGSGSGGSSGGGGSGGGNCSNCATLPIALNEVTGLTSSLSTINNALATINSTLSGVSTAVNTNTSALATLTTNVNGIGSNVASLSNTVAGLQSTVNQITSTSVTVAFVDGEVPSGAVNGNNTVFTLSQTPSPTTSLEVYLNGLMEQGGVDYTLAGNTITFSAKETPATGDVIQAYYRVPGAGPAANFSDAENPAGTINGTNPTFTLAGTPNPVMSLKLYKNGLLLQQNNDYTLSGSTITFKASVVPQGNDSLVAFYRTTAQ